MLNLKELEKRLDDALAKETKESLTSWLMSKRFKNYITGSGEGEFDILLSKSSTLSESNNSVVKEKGYTLMRVWSDEIDKFEEYIKENLLR